EVRELLDIPVLTFMEAACHTACTMGQNFGLIATNRRMVPHYQEIVARYGLDRRCGGIEAIDFSNIRGLNDVFASKGSGIDCLNQIVDAARHSIALTLTFGFDALAYRCAVSGFSIVLHHWRSPRSQIALLGLPVRPAGHPPSGRRDLAPAGVPDLSESPSIREGDG